MSRKKTMNVVTNDAQVTSEKVAAILQQHGWSPVDGVAIAIRNFASVVGAKSALVYLQNYGAATENYILAGDFPSEGRNALEASFELLPKKATDAELALVVKKFATRAAKVIAGTYAVSLLNGRMQPKELMTGKNGLPAIKWQRPGLDSCSEPPVVTVVTEYASENERVMALGELVD